MNGIARISDSISHGGQIITGSGDTYTNSLGTARVGDSAVCEHEDHGVESIITGSSTIITNGAQTAWVTSQLTCGATVITGSGDRMGGDSTGSGGSGGGGGGCDGFNQTDVKLATVFIDGEPHDLGIAEVGARDDEEIDPSDPRYGIVNYPPHPPGYVPTEADIQRSKELGYDPDNPPEIDQTSTNAGAGPEIAPGGCTIIDPNNPGEKISKHIVLSRLSSSAVFPHRIRAQNGLSVMQIACNLQALSINVLDRIIDKYGNGITITSGFRKGEGRSQHTRGEAVDIQFNGQYNKTLSADEWWSRVEWIRDNVPFDQMITEYIGKNAWIHISFKTSGNRRDMRHCIVDGSFPPGLVLVRSKYRST